MVGESPREIGFDDGVEDGEEFAHAGGESDFEGFALRFESLGELTYHGVVPDGVEGGHVQRASDGGSSAADGSPFGGRSAVGIDRRDTHQGGDFFAVDLAEFGEFGDEGHGGDGTDAGNAHQEFAQPPGLFVGLAEFGDLVIERFDPLVEQIDDLLNVSSHGRSAGGFEMIFLLGPQIDELPSPRDQRVQFPLVLRGFLTEDETLGLL